MRDQNGSTLIDERIDGFLVSHGSSTVPAYVVEELLALGSELKDMYGISVDQLVEVAKAGINKINVDTDIRLAVTRDMKEFFNKYPEMKTSASIGEVWKQLDAKKGAFDPRAFAAPIMDTIMYGDAAAQAADPDVARLMTCFEAGAKEAIGPLLVKFGSLGMAPQVEMVTLEEMAERYRKEGI